MPDGDDAMRPNPAHGALEDLLESAESKRESIAEALDKAYKLMDSGEAWTGKSTAKAFLEDLGYRKEDLPGLADRLIEDMKVELNATPAEVPWMHGEGPQ